MKKIPLIAALVLLCITDAVQAQAFQKKDWLLSTGVGFNSQLQYIYTPSREGLTPHARNIGLRKPMPEFSLRAEYGVHKYWGIGAISSVYGERHFYEPMHQHVTDINVEVGALVNFHLYQLIADKTGAAKKMHCDKLDIYLGHSLGYKMTYSQFDDSYTHISHGILMDFHFGARYQVTDRIGVFAEVGTGWATTFNTGVAFKLNAPKKVKPVKTF